MQLRAHPVEGLTGRIRVPGDKSISHRALMLGAMAVGTTGVAGLLEGEDVLATAAALRRLGVLIARTDEGAYEVAGVGVAGLAEPDDVLDLGNAGTATRLLMGLLAGHPFTSFLSGDRSLRARPMGRVTHPLERMGAQFLARSGQRLPLAITGSAELVPIRHDQVVPSAQVKSAVLLAGLHAPGRTSVVEPVATRDHTERMLRHFGARIVVEERPEGGRIIELEGQPELEARDVQVPGDPSSAAFLLVAALTCPGSRIEIAGVGVNPERRGLLDTLRAMGADLTVAETEAAGFEPVAGLAARAGRLDGCEVPAARAPSMIDEFPVLGVAAACARGTTRLRGLAELKVKESDRLAAMAAGLAACGVTVEVAGDDLIVRGCAGRPRGGATIDAHHDHRIAMSFLVLGCAARTPVTVTGAEAIETSFPGFRQLMNRIGARIETLCP
jgi:3-phosphoshikimate 1-carboxyvinyltransferase